jgi:hypothetical protein
VDDDFDLILLVGAVAAVQAGGGSHTKGRGIARSHGAEYKLKAPA